MQDSKQVTVTFNLPGKLTFNRQSVDIPSPKFYIGETVYHLEKDCHPIDMLPRVVTSMTLRYATTREDASQLLAKPIWLFSLKLSKEEYKTEELENHAEHLDSLQQSIDDDGVTIHQQIELFHKYGLVLHEETVSRVWQFLKKHNIQYSATDFQETAMIYLNCGKEIDDFALVA